MAPSGRRPKTKPDDLGCESACTGCQKLHPSSPFIITHPESWYSFYRPTEGRRLSRPSNNNSRNKMSLPLILLPNKVGKYFMRWRCVIDVITLRLILWLKDTCTLIWKEILMLDIYVVILYTSSLCVTDQYNIGWWTSPFKHFANKDLLLWSL